MIIKSNPYQKHTEPSAKNTWYSKYVAHVANKRTNSTLDRYANKNRITLNDGTTFIEFIRKSMLYTEIKDTDQYYFVDAGKKLRPDLISYELFGTPIFYWIILSDNNLVSSLQAQTNLTLRIPELSEVINNKKLI